MTDLMDKLRKELPLREFSRSISWTGLGSSRGLKKEVYRKVEELFKGGIPRQAVLVIEQLPDGGYQITVNKRGKYR